MIIDKIIEVLGRKQIKICKISHIFSCFLIKLTILSPHLSKILPCVAGAGMIVMNECHQDDAAETRPLIGRV